LSFSDEKGNSFTIDHDKLKITVDGNTSEWQFSKDGKPLWIEWMFCHLKDHQSVSMVDSVLIQRVGGGNTSESGHTSSFLMSGPYREPKPQRPTHFFNFGSQKIGSSTKEYNVSFSMDAEFCAWSCQLTSEDKTAEFRTDPARNPLTILNELLADKGPPSSS